MSTLSIPAVPKAESRSRMFSVELSHVLLALLATSVLLLLPHSMDDPDIWWHLKNADWQWHQHAFLRSDHFAWTTEGSPWINYEWLAELPFYAGFRCFGVRSFYLVTAIELECIFGLLFVLARRAAAGNNWAALLSTWAAVFLSTISFGPRTLLVGWLALAVELLLFDGFLSDSPRAQRRLLWAAPLLFLFWVNAHGSWLIGAVIFGLFVVCGWWPFRAGRVESKGWTAEQKRLLSVSAALSGAALFINPYGWHMVAYPFDLAFRQKLNTSHVEEWASLDFHSPRGHLWLAVLGLLFFAQLRRARRWTPFECALLGLAVYSACTYSRFLFLAAILVAPLLARELAELRAHTRTQQRPALNAVVLLLLATIATGRLLPRATDRDAEAARYPLEATRLLARWHPDGPVLTDYLWGGYLEWNTPQIPTFIDSRVDIFERSGVLADYIHLIGLEGTLSILDRYRIRYVLFERNTPVIYLLQHTPGWRIDYQDATTTLMERANHP